MNQKLNDAAIRAVTATGYATQPHLCERWVREVCQHVYGNAFDEFWQASARATALAFLDDERYVVPLTAGSLPGDLLFKTTGSGGDGHVSIRVAGNRVAENSSCHWRDSGQDARGFRTLVDFGHFDVIVRLP